MDWAIKNGEANLLLDLNAENVALDYGFEEDWPILKSKRVKVILDKQNLSLSAGKASFNEVSGGNVRIDIPRIFHTGRILKFKSNLKGESTSLLSFLQEGPLIKNKSDNELLFTSDEGRFFGKVEAAIPLYQGGEILVDGDVTLSKAQLSIGSNLDVDSISGNVQVLS